MRSIPRDFALRTWFAVFIIAASCLAQTQPQTATISGTVVDLANAPIAGAVVILKPTEGITLHTKSDRNGRFAIEAQPGQYTLKISSRGFESFNKPVSLVTSNDRTIQLNVSSEIESGPYVVFEPPIELVSSPFAATLPLKPLSPFKLRPRYRRNHPQIR